MQLEAKASCLGIRSDNSPANGLNKNWGNKNEKNVIAIDLPTLPENCINIATSKN